MLQIAPIQAVQDEDGEFVLRGTEHGNPAYCTFYGRINSDSAHREQDAKDIVTACNAHDQLVAALRMALGYVANEAGEEQVRQIVEALEAACVEVAK